MAAPSMLRLEVATHRGLALEIDADAVEVPSVDGQLGVLPGHVPLLAALRCGLLQIHQGKDVQVIAIGSGFVQVEPARVLVLTEEFARPDTVDPESVRQELKAASERLKTIASEEEGPEHHDLCSDVDWCQARLDAHEVANRI